MRYCVTGAAGMVGSNLSRILVDEGHHLTFGIDDLSRGRKEFFEDPEYLDIFDITKPPSDNWMPPKLDGVFHCAARVGGVAHVMEDEYRNLKNAAIDWAVLDWCLHTNTPLLYVSTCCVYPPWLNYRPLKENDHASVGGPNENGYKPDEGCYGMAKLLGEMAVQAAVREHGLDAKIVRMFNVYGPNEVPDSTAHVIPALIGKVLRKELPLEVWGDGSQKRSYLYVDDAARGIIAAMEKGKPGEVYNLGTETSYTVNALAALILDKCGEMPANVRNDPSKPSGVSARYADISKARTELGWKPATYIGDGLDNTIQWCREWMEKQ